MPNYDKHVVHPPYNAGRSKERIIPAGTAQIGIRQGSHVTHGMEGGGTDTGYHGIDPHSGKPGLASELGNARAASCGQGPGGGRNVYARGQSNGASLSDRPNSPPTGVSKTPLVNLDWKAGGGR